VRQAVSPRPESGGFCSGSAPRFPQSPLRKTAALMPPQLRLVTQPESLSVPLRACFKKRIFGQPPPNGSAGASPYRGVCGRARILPSRGVKKMRFLKHALTRPFAPATMLGLAPLALRVWASTNGRPLHSGPFSLRDKESRPPRPHFISPLSPALGFTPAQARAKGQALMDSNSARAGLYAPRPFRWAERMSVLTRKFAGL
jgi:hypothetical protein